ncbi:serine/threonine protein phosphatase [Blastopirellula marina]|uniref:Serine/threonine protein phosphatase n=1 Tax=Blastopirellula marina TaxID=124 RepID=A0A2S8FF23_9BACT|nr:MULTISPECIES: metallophosphoesterase [Pirellulaceae]PQO30756.1 serine/threonine protein phosphatase [Blastopirellula marina]RCS50893.1 serine/threonine protein phosphatase [Bremerella cremea]
MPPPERLIAIGDIHGHAAALLSLLELIQPTTEDTIVTLGDYVNRGPKSGQVLEILSSLDQAYRHIAILGNHDDMMLESRNDPHAEGRWMYQGGDFTLESYALQAAITDVPDHHWDFLAACLPIFETDQFIFTHANYCWYSQLSEQPSRLLRWTAIEEEPPQAHVSGKTFIVGHSPGEIRDLGFCRCLDTGCGLGGVLTAMDVTSRQIWQVTEAGIPVMRHV